MTKVGPKIGIFSLRLLLNGALCNCTGITRSAFNLDSCNKIDKNKESKLWFLVN